MTSTPRILPGGTAALLLQRRRYAWPVTPNELSDTVVQALRALVERGVVELSGDLPESVVVERPRNSSHGDYATNVALQLGKRSSLKPPALAAALARSEEHTSELQSRQYLVCRLLLEKKKISTPRASVHTT